LPIAVLSPWLALASACGETSCEDNVAFEHYSRRIEPLLLDERPKTCNQCHLSGVDLELFVRETPCETMACLVEMDLVDLEAPAESLVLSWIARATPESTLITQRVIDEEYAGFREWIELYASCGAEACVGVSCTPVQAQDECEVLRTDVVGEVIPPFSHDPTDCSSRAREDAFLHLVYTWRGRCFPCHWTSLSLGPVDTPRFITSEGECGPASLGTMNAVIENGLLDYEDPSQSLLLLKPLAEEAGGVVHGGHDKFADTEDVAYQDILRWIEHEVGCTP
jgi:hypothetical protein